MSDTTEPVPAPAAVVSKPVVAQTTQQVANDSLTSQQFILGLYAMTIVAATVMAVFLRGNDSAINVALGFVFGSMGAGVIGFFFGSSKGSQSKDTTLAAAATTTTTIAPPATVTTTTGAAPP